MARTTIDQLLGDARRRLDRLDPLATLDAIRAGATLIDIRSDSHIAQDGVIRGIPVKPRRSHAARTRLRPATDLDGGFQAWRAVGLPTQPASEPK
jgi:rhodanese-related sulfurtransferase